MSEKMIRFLHSIAIEDAENFDLEFESIMKHPFKKNGWDMTMLKITAWRFDHLELFLERLHHVDYPYELKFRYDNPISHNDVVTLFNSWYFKQYHEENLVPFQVNQKQITFVCDSDSDLLRWQSILNDFNALLVLLFYPFECLVQKREPIISIDSKKIQELSQKIEKEVDVDQSIFMDGVDDDHANRLEEAENQILQEYEQTIKSQIKEENDRTYRRGNYIPMGIGDLKPISGNVEVEGILVNFEMKEYNSKKIIRGVLGSKLKGISITINEDQKSMRREVLVNLEKKNRLRIRGRVVLDEKNKSIKLYAHELAVLERESLREDLAQAKRIELHLHTKMSTMDGVGAIEDYCAVAKNMGHEAIAITDHGVVQGFPEAQEMAEKYGLKMIYGCEVYMVDDVNSHIMNASHIDLSQADIIVFDLETTGLSSRYDRIIEFGAVKMRKGSIIDRLSLLISPEEVSVSKGSLDVSGITLEMLKNKPAFKDVAHTIFEFIKDGILISHNAPFDMGFLIEAFKRENITLSNPVIDTLSLSRYLYAEASNHRLGALAKRVNVDYDTDDAHRADYDAEILSRIWINVFEILSKQHHIQYHDDLNQLNKSSADIKYLRSSHTSILVRNKKGLRALYELVSLAHTTNLSEQPRTPRQDIAKRREHLLIGSACFNGEVFDTARTQTREELLEVMKFYDYIEVQPLENYEYLIHMGQIETKEELKKILSEIISCAEELHKPIVATGDAHYVNPEDKIYRDIFIFTKGLKGVPHPMNPYNRDTRAKFDNPNQHYRTTEEMLEAFAWVGKEKAFEYVVTNSNRINQLIEVVTPISKKLEVPIIEKSDEKLRDLCYSEAYAQYGNPLPPIVEKRLEIELKGIIDNGYAVVYYVTSKILKEAHDQGFLVGSRGSVGSSFAATMARITEVNPLIPHYYCPQCQFSDFQIDEQYRSGFDLPPRKCPSCSTPLKGDGQNIPFATFIGTDANKVPDIDLNFPPDYQAIAQAMTKKMLGNNKVYRSGTVEKVADKTAFGYVKGYLEKMGVNPNEITYGDLAVLAYGCQGVRRTSGQHPGGMVVVPEAFDVNDFTPIQYPADNPEHNIITTHFPFEALHDSLLKFDMLGHLDPLAVRHMSIQTGIAIHDIPLNDPETISIFASDEPLKRKQKFMSLSNGALGTPEFGTAVGISILNTIKPKTFNHLMIISGLSHGKEVFFGNSKEMIEAKKISIDEVIGCRDDIMTYLISKGIPDLSAFKIMEKVRRGNGLSPEHLQIMQEAKVPDHYIDSCKKIKYLFPKAHAAAYVTMAVRVAWFKLHRPLAYYSTFFTIRSKQYDIKTMIQSPKIIFEKLEKYKLQRAQLRKLPPKDEAIEYTLTIALEMKERGYEINNVDIQRSHATEFLIDEEKQSIIPPFIVLDGIGNNAAISIIEARKERPFLSQEDLKRRTKLSQTNIEDLRELGALNSLEERDQVSLFSFAND
jgi:DNA polymerase III subunit alpha, Gram-positive type